MSSFLFCESERCAAYTEITGRIDQINSHSKFETNAIANYSPRIHAVCFLYTVCLFF